MDEERRKSEETDDKDRKTFSVKYSIQGEPFDLQVKEGTTLEDVLKEIARKHDKVDFNKYQVLLSGEVLNTPGGELKRNPVLNSLSVIALLQKIAGGL